MTATTALLILAWVAIVLLALALGGVVAQQRALHAVVTKRARPADRDPIVGELIDNTGNVINPPYVALFVAPGCASCKRVVPAVAETVSTRGDGTVPVFIVSDRAYSSEPVVGGHAVTWLVDQEAAQRFGIPAFPWLVAVGAEGNPTDHAVAHDPHDVTERVKNASPTVLSEEGTIV